MIPIEQSSWIAVRGFQSGPDGRVRFAHMAPWHIEVAGRPVRPRKEEVEFLIRRVRDEIERNANLLSEDAMNEYREALRIYENLIDQAFGNVE